MKHHGLNSCPVAYDPNYDPNVAAHPGCGRDYAPTYWVDTAGPPPEDDGPVSSDMDVDVAIVGSGYTGLSCAIHLAKEMGLRAVVLEANRVGWGCSTRNGGQVQLSAGRLTRLEWIERWGVDVAKELHAEILDAFDVFRNLIHSFDVDCDVQDGGHLYVAHRPKFLSKMESESRVSNDIYGYRTRILGRDEVHRDYVCDQEAAGAMLEPDGMSVHPAKLAFGYLAMARRLGTKVYTASPVVRSERHGSLHYLHTPGGTIRARSVCFATAGYTSPGLHDLTKHRLMPILSNSIVTRPLSSAEREACGFKTGIPITDTRTLRHYYRGLPDGRVQIGTRSAITGADATNKKHLDRLINGMHRKFPALRGIEVDFSWWGWVDVSHDMMPRIYQPDPKQGVFYAMGYGGNGVMYSAQAGRRLAQLVSGKGKIPNLPIFSSALPSHGLLTPFRRIGQRAMYCWYGLKDEVL